MKTMKLAKKYHKQFPKNAHKKFEVRPHHMWPATMVQARVVGTKRWNWMDVDCFS